MPGIHRHEDKMPKITFITDRQDEHLARALELTNTEGWMQDAVVISAYSTKDDGAVGDLLGVAVFENFRGGRAEMHFGYAPGHRLTLEMIQAITLIAFSPSYFNLDTVLTCTPENQVSAICSLLKIGFAFEHRCRGVITGDRDGIMLSLTRERALTPTTADDDSSEGQSPSDHTE